MSATLPFNLEQIRDRLAMREQGPAQSIHRCPTNYLFNPTTEKLIDVGEDGLHLTKPCNGRNSLSDILSALRGRNRKVALDFYRQLFAAGFLCCGERP